MRRPSESRLLALRPAGSPDLAFRAALANLPRQYHVSPAGETADTLARPRAGCRGSHGLGRPAPAGQQPPRRHCSAWHCRPTALPSAPPLRAAKMLARGALAYRLMGKRCPAGREAEAQQEGAEAALQCKMSGRGRESAEQGGQGEKRKGSRRIACGARGWRRRPGLRGQCAGHQAIAWGSQHA